MPAQVRCSPDSLRIGGTDYKDGNVRTGLLPSWLGFHADRTENDLKYGVTIGFQPGIDSGADLTGGPIDGGLGLNSSNFRQVFLEFSSTRWGGIKMAAIWACSVRRRSCPT